jgi:hypothetical protein
MHTNESRGTTQFVQKVLRVVEQEGSMTIMQLFWRLVSAGEIQNDVGNYHRLVQIMTRLREDGRCARLIVDRSQAALTIDGN